VSEPPATGNGRVANGEVLVRIRELEVAYGHVRAVKGVDLELEEAQICVVLGANGAGKSSIIKSIIGLVKPRCGTIEFPAGSQIQSTAPHRIHRRGIAWVPEGRQIFANLSVRENLLMGAFTVAGKGTIDERMQRITTLFPRLGERINQFGGSLSGGEQQMLAFGRALMSQPRVLLLDEPSLGLAPKVVEMLFDLVGEIRDDGISVFMAEQNARQALRVADYAYLLENGEIRGHGTAREMEGREDVRAAYLGG
jgi:branched-chain amino acid transport system ATP-binding protein